MPNTYKELFRGWLPNAVAVVATVPTGKEWIISHVTMVNSNAADQTAALYRNGLTDIDRFTPSNAFLEGAGGMYEFTGRMEFGPGETIAGVASAATSVNLILEGDEVG